MKNQVRLNGNLFAKTIIDKLRLRINKFNNPPNLHIINLGNNPASISYIKKKT